MNTQFKAKPEAMRERAEWPSEIPFIEPIVEKLRREGEPEIGIAQQAYDYMAFQCSLRDFRYTNHLNGQVADGIKALAFEGKWTNLGAIAKHALEAEIRAIEAEIANTGSDDLLQFMLENTQLKLDFLKCGVSEFKDFITRLVEAQEKEERRMAEFKARKDES